MSIYEEVEIQDMYYDSKERVYTYPCPCGDKFRITLSELWDGEDIAKCPSCTLQIMVIYDEEDLPDLVDDDDDDDDDEGDQVVKSEEGSNDDDHKGRSERRKDDDAMVSSLVDATEKSFSLVGA